MTASTGKSLDGLRMRTVATAVAGEVDGNTLFLFGQRGNTVWARYAGGAVELGYLVGSVTSGRLTLLPDGRVRMLEHFHWESREGSGTNVLEEVDAGKP
jgi:hypothetical protein